MRARRKPTPAQLYAAAQEMELLGMTEDGRLVLWDTGRVLPVSQFQYRRDKLGRRWIDDGHFVINWFARRWSRISATSLMAVFPWP